MALSLTSKPKAGAASSVGTLFLGIHSQEAALAEPNSCMTIKPAIFAVTSNQKPKSPFIGMHCERGSLGVVVGEFWHSKQPGFIYLFSIISFL